MRDVSHQGSVRRPIVCDVSCRRSVQSPFLWDVSANQADMQYHQKMFSNRFRFLENNIIDDKPMRNAMKEGFQRASDFWEPAPKLKSLLFETMKSSSTPSKLALQTRLQCPISQMQQQYFSQLVPISRSIERARLSN